MLMIIAKCWLKMLKPYLTHFKFADYTNLLCRISKASGYINEKADRHNMCYKLHGEFYNTSLVKLVRKL